MGFSLVEETNRIEPWPIQMFWMLLVNSQNEKAKKVKCYRFLICKTVSQKRHFTIKASLFRAEGGGMIGVRLSGRTSSKAEIQSIKI